jgi:hypothetical protein
MSVLRITAVAMCIAMVSVAQCKGVAPDAARVRVVNMMPGIGYLKDVMLVSNDGKMLRHVKYGKGKGFIKKATGPIEFTLISEYPGGGQLLNENAFPTSLAGGHDYLLVLNRLNDGTSEPAALNLDFDRAVQAPGDGYARVILINTMVGHDLVLSYDPGSVMDSEFEQSDVEDALLHTGTYTFTVKDQLSLETFSYVTLKMKSDTSYYVIFGGTTDPNDIFPPLVNVYKTKY